MKRAVFTICFMLINSVSHALEITDATGHVVTLPKPAQRIVSLAPHITELLFSLEVGDRVVATVAYSDYPEAAKRIPRIGGAEDVSIESVLAAQPDLVVAWEGGSSDALLALIEATGIPVYRTMNRDMQSITKGLMDLAILTERQPLASQLIEEFDAELAAITAKYRHKARVSVFYQLWHEPLMTANKQQLISEMIALCGGDNLFSGRTEVVPQTSLESVVLLNPEIIIAPQQGSPANWTQPWLAWPEVKAVAHGQLKTVNADLTSRPTLRSSQGLSEVCQLIDQARDFQ